MQIYFYLPYIKYYKGHLNIEAKRSFRDKNYTNIYNL